MAKNMQDFENIVNNREQFHDQICVETVAIKVDEDWVNVHTDIHLQPEDSKDYLSNSNIYEPSGYFMAVVPFENFPDLLREMIRGDFEAHDEQVRFLGLSDESDSDLYWKEAIVHGSRHPRYDDLQDVYGIRIQSAENPYRERKRELEERLRRSERPYRDFRDLVDEWLRHTSFEWRKPRIQCFAPLYIRRPERELTDDGEFRLNIEAHDSIEEIRASTWTNDENEITERTAQGSLNQTNLDGSFRNHSLSWQLDHDPEQILYSLFPSGFDEIQGSFGQSTSHIYKILGIVLDLNPNELADMLDKYSTEQKRAQDDDSELGNDFEANVITLFSLGGFAAFSPEWFDHESDKGSLPDVLAFANTHETVVVCECTTSERIPEIKAKAEDALSSTERIESKLNGMRYDLSIIPVCATPVEHVDSVIDIDRSVFTLTSEELCQMRKLASQYTDPNRILTELDIE